MSTSVHDLAGRFIAWISQQGLNSVRPDKSSQAVGVAQVTQPWESWELDEEFFRALSRWTLDNPETTLDRVLDNIRDGLEHSKDLLGLIPENPFPARGLVTALAYLLRLGVSIRRAQRDVQEFAKDVVQWVGLVKSAFESAGDGNLARRAWRDLRHMRDLIDKISSWAVERLNDGRWLRIGHGLTISKEIKEFNERIIKARTLFQDLSAINLTRGLDALMRKLRNILATQQTITSEIQEIRQTQKKQLDRIVNELELQKQVAERERFFAKTLDSHAITSSAYDHQGKRPCDEDTRVQVLEDIRTWRNDIKHGSTNFLWLTGDPGCGKSAVTASFARECKDEGVLWAQFFINRNNAETTDPRSYFPTIARQLADYSQEVAQAIHLMLVKQRSLTDDISAEQAAHLFTDSIRKASVLDPDRPIVVVIDGLDETNRDRLEDTAIIFSTLFTTLGSYSNVKVFISSRTENEIQKPFSLPLTSKHVKRVHLNTADPLSIRDVSHYIKRNLLDLVEKHDLNWNVWPGDDRSRVLGLRASGLFIWAVTAVKFIQEELESHGEECLDEVLTMLTAEVLHDINALYTLILTVTFRHRQDTWEFERFRRILGAIVCLQQPLCVDDLAALLDLRRLPSGKPVDVVHFVRRFRTILVAGTDAVDGSTIPRVHKSVYEFITSNSVETQFRVEPNHAHLELAIQCLAFFGTVPEGFKGDDLAVPLRYACRFWRSHLSHADGSNPMASCCDYRQYSLMSLPSMFPRSLDPSYFRKLARVHYSAHTSKVKMKAKTTVTGSGDGFRIWDAVSGIRISHGATVRAVVPSLDGKDVVSCSDDGTIRVWDSTNAEFRRILVTDSGPFHAIAISPDNKSIASSSDPCMLILWDRHTGAPIWKSSHGKPDKVFTIVFSPDGKFMVSVCEDMKLRLLNAYTGDIVGDPWIGHMAHITGVAFASTSSKVCSVDTGGSCIIWDVNTGQKTDRWEYVLGHRSPSTCVFSPKDDGIIALYGGSVSGIQIRSHKQVWGVPNSQYTLQLLFSSDGKEIIFGNNDTISVAVIGEDEQTTRLVRSGDFAHRSLEPLIAFSPNWEFAYSRSNRDDTIGVYSLQHSQTTLKVLPAHDESHLIDLTQLIPTLSNMKGIENNPYAVTNNQHLDATKWYELTDGTGTGVKLCMVIDDDIIAGYDNGSVAVWPISNPRPKLTKVK